jgi:hypothetical protein
MAAATLTFMVLTLTGQVVALRSDKPFVTSEDSAQVELSVLDDSGRPLKDVQVELTVNVGSVTPPTADQDGTFRATYQPPAQEGAQVALVHATVKQAASTTGAWLALPIHGPYSLRVQASPRSRVSVSIGAASYGPVVAAANGEAVVSVKLPPGATSAQVTIAPRSGKSRTQTVALPAPHFARVQLVALEAPVQGRPVRLQGFAVDDSGNPAVALPPLAVSAEQGTLGPIEAREGGVFEVMYTASAQSTAPVKLSASPLEEADRPSTLQLEPRPAPVASGTRAGPSSSHPGPASGTAVASSQRKPWQPTVGAFLLAHSNAAAAKGLAIQLEGALRLGSLPWEALLQLEGRGNDAVSETLPTVDGATAVTKTFTLGGAGARLGARWSHPVLTRGLFFADASAGVLRMTGEVKLVSTTSTASQKLRSVGPSVSVGGGFGWMAGPGRLCGEVQWGYAPGRGSVSGNLGGLSLGLGYQFILGGTQAP